MSDEAWARDAKRFLEWLQGPEPRQSLEESMDDIEATRKRLEELEARFKSYDGGDRPQSPPMDLLREILELKARLVRAEIESCEAMAKETGNGSK